MQIQANQFGMVSIISLVGSLDSKTADEVDKFLESLLRGGSTKLVLDLLYLDFMSSAGLRVIVSNLKAARKQGGDLRLANVHDFIINTLEVTGLTGLIQIFNSSEEAVASYSE
jgi:anti-anti-sigma factor